MEQLLPRPTPARVDLGPVEPSQSGTSAEQTAVTLSNESVPLQPINEWAETLSMPASKGVAQSNGTAYGASPHALWREAAADLPRIRIDPAVLRGIPLLRDTRISVAQLLDMLADGENLDQLLEEFPGQLELADLREALIFASRLAR